MGFILIVSVVVYIFLSFLVASIARIFNRKYRIILCNFWLVLCVMFLIPVWDIPIGRGYHSYLCRTQAGIFVYDTVKLDDKYFYRAGDINMGRHTKDGKSHAIAKGGEINRQALRERYSFEFSRLTEYSPMFHISKRSREILDKANGTILGESVSFVYSGGWLETRVAGSARYCGEQYTPLSQQNVHFMVFNEVFGQSEY